MTSDGWPQALFTVNAWAIGERPELAAMVKEYARRFRLGDGRGPRALVRFIKLVFQAFLPEIERLQDEKDAVLADYRRLKPGQDPYEDRTLGVLSRIAIHIRG
jgi:hypothetical protein